MSSPERAALRLGTRRSPLALHQANLARDAIQRIEPGLAVELVEITSDGDRDPRELREINDRGIFASELERQLRDGRIDAAVHSSKDLALDDPADLALVAWLPRADPRDALVAAPAGFMELPAGATVATGSARRVASLLTLRGDVASRPIRGNVTTRIERARERGDSGLVLAMAGLVRLGLADDPELSVRPFAVEDVVPEAGQGAVVIQASARRCARTGLEWARLDDTATRRAAQLERSLARRLGGGCMRPVGVHVQLDAGRLHGFFAPAPDVAGRRVSQDLVGLELATLLSTTAPDDVDEAAEWTAGRIAPELAQALGATLAEAAR